VDGNLLKHGVVQQIRRTRDGANADGRLGYRPATNSTVFDTFAYSKRRQCSERRATVTLKSHQWDDGPVELGDAYAMAEDTR